MSRGFNPAPTMTSVLRESMATENKRKAKVEAELKNKPHGQASRHSSSLGYDNKHNYQFQRDTKYDNRKTEGIVNKTRQSSTATTAYQYRTTSKPPNSHVSQSTRTPGPLPVDSEQSKSAATTGPLPVYSGQSKSAATPGPLPVDSKQSKSAATADELTVNSTKESKPTGVKDKEHNRTSDYNVAGENFYENKPYEGNRGRYQYTDRNSTASNRPYGRDWTNNTAGNSAASNQKSVDHQLNENLYFYQNKMKSKPYPGHKIEEMLSWKGDYSKLESNHQYIQWLFPNFGTRGLNSSAQPLQYHEAVEIAETPELKERFVGAYKMMLHFYGMELASDDTGEIRQCKENWKERFQHLNGSKHNHWRITRILNALAAFGLNRYQEPLILFVISMDKYLPRLQGGTLDYWLGTVQHSPQETKSHIKDEGTSVDGKDFEPQRNANASKADEAEIVQRDVTKECNEENEYANMTHDNHGNDDLGPGVHDPKKYEDPGNDNLVDDPHECDASETGGMLNPSVTDDQQVNDDDSKMEWQAAGSDGRDEQGPDETLYDNLSIGQLRIDNNPNVPTNQETKDSLNLASTGRISGTDKCDSGNKKKVPFQRNPQTREVGCTKALEDFESQ